MCAGHERVDVVLEHTARVVGAVGTRAGGFGGGARWRRRRRSSRTTNRRSTNARSLAPWRSPRAARTCTTRSMSDRAAAQSRVDRGGGPGGSARARRPP
eukprot:3514058-Prymnesium_polylepis.1